MDEQELPATKPVIREFASQRTARNWRVVRGAGSGMGTGVALFIYAGTMFIAPIIEVFG